MTGTPPPKLTYDTSRMTTDMAAKGWIAQDLAREAGVSHMAVSRFLRGISQSPRMAKKLAWALGKSPAFYLITISGPRQRTVRRA